MFFNKYAIRTLDDALDWSLRNLAKGAASFRHPFHSAGLATVGGGRPEVRTVILRGFSGTGRRLTCYCDARSPKVAQIRESPRSSWLFYHPKNLIQLRLSGPGAVHTDDETADAEWARVRPTSRVNYCTEMPPGSAAAEPTSGLAPLRRGRAALLPDRAAARKNFAVIVCRFDEVDWLMLKIGGNRRAKFQWEGDRVEATWAIP